MSDPKTALSEGHVPTDSFFLWGVVVGLIAVGLALFLSAFERQARELGLAVLAIAAVVAILASLRTFRLSLRRED